MSDTSIKPLSVKFVYFYHLQSGNIYININIYINVNKYQISRVILVYSILVIIRRATHQSSIAFRFLFMKLFLIFIDL